jgi:MYXO-CTERM domain-containing protein
VAGPTTGCDQGCLTLESLGPEVVEERGVVELAWGRDCIEWTLDPAGTPDLDQGTVAAVIQDGFDRWTGAACGGGRRIGFDITRLDVADLDCPYIDHRRNIRNVNVVTFVDDWRARDNDPAALALTTVHFDSGTGEILGADIEIENEARRWAECPGLPNDCGGRYDLSNVVVHELGHFLGLAHTPDDEDATMWACSRQGEVLKRDLAPDDVDGICAIYPEGSLGACRIDTDAAPVTTCTFLGDECDPRDPDDCTTGRCVDLGDGPVCTIPCGEDPTVCGDRECLPPDGRRVEAVCDPPRSGCGCRVGGRPTPGWPLLGLGLILAVALRRRR